MNETSLMNRFSVNFVADLHPDSPKQVMNCEVEPFLFVRLRMFSQRSGAGPATLTKDGLAFRNSFHSNNFTILLPLP